MFYANTFAINITERVVVKMPTAYSPTSYYTYDISDGVRSDQISDSYYNDQYMDWLLYMSNQIIDPYYEWYLPPNKFHDFLVAKYKTNIYNLQNKISYFRNNWYISDNITVSDYNALPSNHHRYWQPIYNNDTGQIIRYTRANIDWKINTNSLVKISCDGSNFTNNEVVYVNFDGTHSGRGQVAFANSTSIQIQHVSGTLYSNNTVVISGSSYVYGTESQTNVAFTSTACLANTIPVGEEIYWDPVTIYDDESEKNEKNRTIKVIDNGISMAISDQLSTLLVP